MLTASVFDLRYCRVPIRHFTREESVQLAAEYDYVFAVCYGSCDTGPEYETIQKNACLIDLTAGAEVAFSRFNATCRNLVRRAEHLEGLLFHAQIQGEFEPFYSFYSHCEHLRNWRPVPREELQNSLVFYASFDGQPVSGISCYAHDRFLRVGRIFSLKRSEINEKLTNLLFGSAARRIVYNLCQYAAANGFEYLDLSGIDLESPDKAGITQFKLSFGGQVTPVTIARYANARFLAQSRRILEAGYDIT